MECQVEFDYEAEMGDELSIRSGDVITGVKQLEGGWWEGTCKGKRGLFPDNFVKVRKNEERGNSVDREAMYWVGRPLVPKVS